MSFDLVISFPRISSTEICTYYLKRRGYEDRQCSNVCNSRDYKQPTRPKRFCFLKLWSSLTMNTASFWQDWGSAVWTDVEPSPRFTVKLKKERAEQCVEYTTLCTSWDCICPHHHIRKLEQRMPLGRELGDWEQGQERDLPFRAFFTF